MMSASNRTWGLALVFSEEAASAVLADSGLQILLSRGSRGTVLQQWGEAEENNMDQRGVCPGSAAANACGRLCATRATRHSVGWLDGLRLA